MTTKAVEAGARAIWEARKSNDLSAWTTKNAARLCIEAAIASGELVPASAVAAERERCIQAIRNTPCPDEAGYYTMTKDEAIDIIRDLEPASGEGVAKAMVTNMCSENIPNLPLEQLARALFEEQERMAQAGEEWMAFDEGEKAFWVNGVIAVLREIDRIGWPQIDGCRVQGRT